MDPDLDKNTGCLFPFGDDFLSVFMFFFHLNAQDPNVFYDENACDEDSENG